MFTQQHYRAIADVFAASDPYELTGEQFERQLAEALAAMFANDNPKFRPDLFFAACQLASADDAGREEPTDDEEPELDFSARYRVDGYDGVAWRLIGYCAELVYPECPGHSAADEPNDGHAGIGDVVYCDGSCQPAEEEEDRSQVRAVMVGDDRQKVIDVGDLTELDDADYCCECGQIGCNHDGREV